MRTPIIDTLEDYLQQDVYPWHMPGHKRKIKSYIEQHAEDDKYNDSDKLDIISLLKNAHVMDMTEVPGVDDLHDPHEMIADSMEELKKVYGSAKSYYLVNGSTCGIFSAIAAVNEYDTEKASGIENVRDTEKTYKKAAKIIVADNCHKSVFNAAKLLGLKETIVPTSFAEEVGIDIHGVVNCENLRHICEENPDAMAIIVTSPTYDGIISDIGGISRVAHEYGMKLIVDEAHGAHLPFISREKSAIANGADIVIQSLHKTLASFTQTAIMHTNDVRLCPYIEKYLHMFMSSSPSYILMASMELAVKEACDMDFGDYLGCLKEFRKKAEKLKNIHILTAENMLSAGAYDYDETRIVLYADVANKMQATDGANKTQDADGVSGRYSHNGKFYGKALEDMLAEKGMVVEMSGLDYVVLISTYMDEKKDFDRLFAALSDIDIAIKNRKKNAGSASYNTDIEKHTKSVVDKVDTEEHTKSVVDKSDTKTHTKSVVDKSDAEENIDELLNSLIDKIAPQDIYIYPPGIPIIHAGAKIDETDVEKLRELHRSGKTIHGL